MPRCAVSRPCSLHAGGARRAVASGTPEGAGPNAASGQAIMRQAVNRIRRGIADALRSRPGVFICVAAGVLALDLLLPPAVLSFVRKPFDYFAFNAWLSELPRYILRGD